MDAQLVYIVKQGAFLLMEMSAIIMLPLLVVGLLFGIIQAATSIQEMTLSAIPKFFVLIIIILYFGNHMTQRWLTFVDTIIAYISVLR